MSKDFNIFDEKNAFFLKKSLKNIQFFENCLLNFECLFVKNCKIIAFLSNLGIICHQYQGRISKGAKFTANQRLKRYSFTHAPFIASAQFRLALWVAEPCPLRHLRCHLSQSERLVCSSLPLNLGSHLGGAVAERLRDCHRLALRESSA